jgi:hypothetical protein
MMGALEWNSTLPPEGFKRGLNTPSSPARTYDGRRLPSLPPNAAPPPAALPLQPSSSSASLIGHRGGHAASRVVGLLPCQLGVSSAGESGGLGVAGCAKTRPLYR